MRLATRPRALAGDLRIAGLRGRFLPDAAGTAARGTFTSAGGNPLARFIAAYALRQPDALIGGAAPGPYRGNNVYSASASGEVRRVSVTRGRTVTSYVKIQNDGLATADFLLTAVGGARGISSTTSGARPTSRPPCGPVPTPRVTSRSVPPSGSGW